MNLKLETEFSKAPILEEVDALKNQIDGMRPLSPEIEGRVMQKLKLEWNYNSNAIEGNKLSYGETTALLMHGITAKGKPLKDHLDIRGHNKALEYLDTIIKDDRDFTEADVRGLHEVILGESYDSPAQTAEGLPTSKHIQIGKYKSMPNHVQTITGAIHYYATPEETPAKMTDLMNWYEATKEAGIHPVITAALFHHRFVAIHPFDDGNGRMARILMNLILMKNGYPPVVIKTDNKESYYALLSQADAGEDLPFIEHIVERLVSSMGLYIKASNGGDIDEDEDIDKEIALLKMQLNGGVSLKEKKSHSIVNNMFFEMLIPLSFNIADKLKSFQDYFFETKDWLHFTFMEKIQDVHLVSRFIRLQEDNLPQYEHVFNNLAKDMKLIGLEFEFNGYKNPLNSFNLNISFQIDFGEFYYKVIFDKKVLISKLYHERFLAEDQNVILKKVIDNLKFQINENQKSPESN